MKSSFLPKYKPNIVRIISKNIFLIFNQAISSNLNCVNSCIVVAGLVNKLKTTRPNHAKYALRTILPADTAAFCGSKKNPKSSIVDRVPADKFNDKIPW